jgi:hypothetical protein
MSRRVKIAAAAAVLGVGALAAVFSGVLPLGATSGHWAVTEWLLQFTKRRTVKARAAGLEAPNLGEPGLVLRGAVHYETGCRPCHGSPGSPRPFTLVNMLPRPPLLV